MTQTLGTWPRTALRLGMIVVMLMCASQTRVEAYPQVLGEDRPLPVLGDLAREERARRAAGVGAVVDVSPTPGIVDSLPATPLAADPVENTGKEADVQPESPGIADARQPDHNEAAPTHPVTSLPTADADALLADTSSGNDGDDPDPTPTDVPSSSLPFLVSAGVDQTIVLPDSRSLPVAVSLTGLVSAPRRGNVEVEWSQVSGPEPVGFLGGHRLETRVALVAPGEYELRLTVSTGAETRSSDVRITLILSRQDTNTPRRSPEGPTDPVGAGGRNEGPEVARFLPAALVGSSADSMSVEPGPVVREDDVANLSPNGEWSSDALDLLSSDELEFPDALGDETFASAVPTASDLYPFVEPRRTGSVEASDSETNLSVYVSKNGDDRSAGTKEYPYRTIRKALENVGPGDTLFIREGTYDQGVDTLSEGVPSGTSFDEAVTIRAYPGERVILKPGTGFAVLYLSGSVSYTTWQDIVIDGGNLTYPGARGIELLNGASYNRFENIEVRNVGGSGILVAGDRNTNNEFLGMIVHDVAQGPDGEGHGIHVISPDNIIDGGEWYEIDGDAGDSWAIHIGGGDQGADRNVVRNARIHDNRFGIALGSGDDNLAYNNLIYDNLGLAVRIDFGTGSDGNGLLNNTIVGNPGPAVQVGAEGVLSSTEIANNIFWQNGVDAVADAGVDTVIESNVSLDPLFVNSVEKDFRLMPDSPAIDAGTTLPEVLWDVDGVPRPQGDGFDAGAYEYPSL